MGPHFSARPREQRCQESELTRADASQRTFRRSQILKRMRATNCPKKIKLQPNATNFSFAGLLVFLSAQEWTNRTPNATNKSMPCFLVLAGSESSFTEIADSEYVYFSLM